MKLENVNQALAIGLEMYETLKKCDEVCQKKGQSLIDRYEKQYWKAQEFFGEKLPKYVRNNKIKGENLEKVIKLTMKAMQFVYMDQYEENLLDYYFNKQTMQNQSILKEIAKACIKKDGKGNYTNRYYLENKLVEYNFAYFENYILSNADIDETTYFAIEHKNRPDIHLNKFEEKVLNEGKFKNLYDYLYEIKECNQKAVLTKILEVATDEELKQFSRSDEDAKSMQEARDSAYSLGYSLGGYDPY